MATPSTTLQDWLLAWLIFEAVFFLPSIFYLRAIVKAMRLSRAEGLPKSRTVWLELMPLFSLVWQFRNVRVARKAFPKQKDSDGDETRPHAYLELAAEMRLLAVPLVLVAIAERPTLLDASSTYDALGGGVLVLISGHILWQRIRYARQVKRLCRGEPAEGFSLAVIESREPPLCSCSAEISTDPDSVKEACLTWARDHRWHRVKKKEDPLTFRMYGRLHPASWVVYQGAVAEVYMSPRETATRYASSRGGTGMVPSSSMP